MLIIPPRFVATCFALACFAATVVMGLAVGLDAATILRRAMMVLLLAWLFGWAVGAVMAHVLAAHLARYEQANPLPDEQAGEGRDEADSDGGGADGAWGAESAASSSS